MISLPGGCSNGAPHSEQTRCPHFIQNQGCSRFKTASTSFSSISGSLSSPQACSTVPSSSSASADGIPFPAIRGFPGSPIVKPRGCCATNLNSPYFPYGAPQIMQLVDSLSHFCAMLTPFKFILLHYTGPMATEPVATCLYNPAGGPLIIPFFVVITRPKRYRDFMKKQLEAALEKHSK